MCSGNNQPLRSGIVFSLSVCVKMVNVILEILEAGSTTEEEMMMVFILL